MVAAQHGRPVEDLAVELVTKTPLSNGRSQSMNGLGRYAASLSTALASLGVHVDIRWPQTPAPAAPLIRGLKALNLDLSAFVAHYPLRISLNGHSVIHLSSQNLATLLLPQRIERPVIVTVHDILPYLLRHDGRLSTYRHPAHRLFDGLAMRGLRRADQLIAVSEFTKRTVVETLGIDPDRITVVHQGVDHRHFRPTPPSPAFRERYGLPGDHRYVLHTGSEEPRKNIASLIRAVAQVRQKHPDVILLRVGAPYFHTQRSQLRALVDRIGLKGAVRWFDQVPEAHLPMFYSLADVFVFPSLYEGFGFPVLEAMACGTPVVCAGTASLPEITGEAALQVAPTDVEGIAAAICRFLDHPWFVERYREWGRERSRRFRWAETARQTCQVYQRVLR